MMNESNENVFPKFQNIYTFQFFIDCQRTDKFTPQQVWGLEFKMEKRLKRLDKIENP